MTSRRQRVSHLRDPRDTWGDHAVVGDVITRPRGRSSRRERRRVMWAQRILALGVMGVAVLAGIGALTLTRAEAPAAPTTPAAIVAEANDGDSREEADPTPRFATLGDVTLRLPLEPHVLTVLAFHQASGDKAQHLKSLVSDVSAASIRESIAAARAATGTVFAAASQDVRYTDETGVWTGSAIRLYRSNRTGAPDTAVDVGAPAGTDVYSPVTGTVLQAREYLLYGKYPDWEVHIRPDGHPELDCVIIHIGDVTVEAGDRVSAGVTRIASVRDLSKAMYMQLAEYTTNGGTHVHVQMNAVEASGRLEELTES